MKKLISKITKILSYCLFGLIISLSVFTLTLKFLGEAPNIFGYNFYYVLTQSMEPEISAGEIIIGQKVEPESLRVGDIVTYKGESGSVKNKIITHKIIDINDGMFTTQGVANDIPDPPIYSTQIISKYVASVPLAGKIFTVINTEYGFIFLIVTPLVLLIINEISTIVKAFKENKEEHLSE